MQGPAHHNPHSWIGRFAVLSIALAALIASPAWSAIYTWKDAEGRSHFTDDLSKIPAAARASLERDTSSERPSRLNLVQAAPRSVMLVAPERSGEQLQVTAVLNRTLEQPFIVDTGAMMSVIPRATAEALGLRIDAATPRVQITGISGKPQAVPLVTLSSTSVSGATVRDLQVAVVDSLDVGLLGMSFLGRFSMSIDPERGTLKLSRRR